MPRSMLAIIAAVALSAAPGSAQTSPQVQDASATVVITPFLTLATSIHMDFGSVFVATGGVTTGEAATLARWGGQTDPGNTLSISFAIPNTLARTGGGGTEDVTFTCGTTAGHYFNSTDQRFDPYVGTQVTLGATGEFNVDLGWEQGVPGTNECAVSWPTSPGPRVGTYTGVITLTVAVL